DLWLAQYAYVSVTDTIALGVSLSLEGLAVEGGWLRSSADQVERYRRAVAGSAGAVLQATGEDLRAGGLALFGIELRTTPPGYARDHRRARLLRRRSLVAARELGRGSWLESAEALDRVRAEWRRLQPLTAWLATHVGPRQCR